jgi:hypothetical protein
MLPEFDEAVSQHISATRERGKTSANLAEMKNERQSLLVPRLRVGLV